VLTERNPSWLADGRQFLDAVSNLLERLLEYKKILKVRPMEPSLSFLGV